MTDRQTFPLTYEGSLARGIISLPSRQVAFARHDTVAFTLDELPHVDAVDWTGDRPDADVHEDPGTGEDRTGVEVPVGATATLISDATGPDFTLVDGQALGPIAKVLALATTAERAKSLLDHEVATKNRKTLVAQLAELAGGATHPADPAPSKEA